MPDSLPIMAHCRARRASSESLRAGARQMGVGDGGGQRIGGIGLRHAAGRQQALDHELHLVLAGMAGADHRIS